MILPLSSSLGRKSVAFRDEFRFQDGFDFEFLGQFYGLTQHFEVFHRDSPSKMVPKIWTTEYDICDSDDVSCK